MRKTLLSAAITFFGLVCTAQSTDERIAHAMNTSDWFALDSIYNEAPKDSINPFLEVLSRGLLGNRLNRPDVSIPAFEDLLNNHSASLDLSNLLNSAVMLSMDYSKVGENSKAASVLTSVVDATKQYLDSAAVEGMQLYIDRYKALSAYRPYSISIAGIQGAIPFSITPVGNPEKNSVLMMLDNSSVNGIKAEIAFDTGAGVNIISDSLARKLNLIPLEAYNNVMGIGRQTTQYAIAKRNQAREYHGFGCAFCNCGFCCRQRGSQPIHGLPGLSCRKRAYASAERSDHRLCDQRNYRSGNRS